MLDVLVVDDEPGVRADLVRTLRRESDVRITGTAGSVGQAAELVRRDHPDVVLLDIHLGDESGFDLLRAAGDVEFHTVFVTAYDEYAVRAFEVNALDYLLKPAEPERLRAALDRVRRLLEGTVARTVESPADAGMTARSTAADDGSRADARPLRYDDWLFLRFGSGRGFLKVAEISHVTAEGDYTAVYTTLGERHLILKPLREWASRLPEPHFLRIHRNALINLARIEHVEPWSNYTYRIYLRGYAEPLVMSRSYAKRAEHLLG